MAALDREAGHPAPDDATDMDAVPDILALNQDRLAVVVALRTVTVALPEAARAPSRVARRRPRSRRPGGRSGSASGSSLCGVGHEPRLGPGRCRTVNVVASEEVAHDLSGAGKFAPSVAGPARVGKGEIELGEGPGKGGRTAGFVPGLACPDCPADVRSGIPELLGEGHPLPALGHEIRVKGHGTTTRPTSSSIDARTSGSSTERVQFPWLGRRLIIESNSRNPAVPNSPG